MAAICRALRTLAIRSDVQIVWPVHRNPNVAGPAHAMLSGFPSIHLIEPLPYVAFVDLMLRANVLVTDSGGIQEEAPSLGKPAIVMRARTERVEGVESGAVRLVGTDESLIVSEVLSLLDSRDSTGPANLANPYGDGKASARIAAVTLDWFRRLKQSESRNVRDAVNA
jgi:UDP-N-acetylglucosamine 2-epimerase (non-hydrolysing)